MELISRKARTIYTSGTRHLPVDLVESLISSIVHNKAIGKKGGRG